MTTEPKRFLDEHLEGLIDALELACDENSVRIALQQFAGNVGFERYAYAHIRGAESRIFSNYPDEWLRHYFANNYFAIDPVVTDGKRSMEPFNWSALDMYRQGGEVRRMAMEADEFGIRSGFSIPIKAGFGRTAMLTLASNRKQSDRIAIRNLAEAVTAAAYVHMSIVKLPSQLPQVLDVTFSAREAICLTWASYGKTMAETGTMLGIAENTVRFYINQARAKLGATNVAHAIRLAVERNLI